MSSGTIRGHHNEIILKGDFWFFYALYSILFNLPTSQVSNFTVSEDAGIEPRTVATTALTVRRSNHSAKSHPETSIFTSDIFIKSSSEDAYSESFRI